MPPKIRTLHCAGKRIKASDPAITRLDYCPAPAPGPQYSHTHRTPRRKWPAGEPTPLPSAAQVHFLAHSLCAYLHWRLRRSLASQSSRQARLAAQISAIPCPIQYLTTCQSYKSHTTKGHLAIKAQHIATSPGVNTSSRPAHQIKSTLMTAAPHGNCSSRHSWSTLLRSRRCSGYARAAAPVSRTQLHPS